MMLKDCLIKKIYQAKNSDLILTLKVAAEDVIEIDVAKMKDLWRDDIPLDISMDVAGSSNPA